jgi:hypothetical protein
MTLTGRLIAILPWQGLDINIVISLLRVLTYVSSPSKICSVDSACSRQDYGDVVMPCFSLAVRSGLFLPSKVKEPGPPPVWFAG